MSCYSLQRKGTSVTCIVTYSAILRGNLKFSAPLMVRFVRAVKSSVCCLFCLTLSFSFERSTKPPAYFPLRTSSKFPQRHTFGSSNCHSGICWLDISKPSRVVNETEESEQGCDFDLLSVTKRSGFCLVCLSQ